MIVLDTHAWLWWLSDSPELSAKAKKAINAARKRQEIHISVISTWEVAMLIAKGRLSLGIPIQEWVAKTESLSFVSFAPIDNALALESVMLPGTFHADPADRMIVATARRLNATLISRDKKIHGYSHVKALW